MKIKRIIIAILLLVIILFILYLLLFQKKGTKDYIETTGILEATEINLSSKIPGRISWLCCKEGDSVRAGRIVIRLDDSELKARVLEGETKLKRALASVKVARTNLHNSRVEVESARAELEAADAEVARMRSIREKAGRDLERAKGLFKDGFISKRDLDTAQTDYDSNNALLESVRAHKRSSLARLRTSLSKVKVAEANLAASKMGRKEAEAQLKVLKIRLSDTEIRVPIDGTIAYKGYEIGEVVNPGDPVYTLFELKNLWARADIEESVISWVRLSGRADVITLSTPSRKFEGRVIEIGREAEFATQKDVTRGREDIKTFRVKVAIENPEGFLKPGMTVKVRIYKNIQHGGFNGEGT